MTDRPNWYNRQFSTWSEQHGLVLILVYVDDMQIAAARADTVRYFKQQILNKFPGKDLGKSGFYLQMTIVRDRINHTTILRQQRHIDSLLEQTGLNKAHPVSIPMGTNVYSQPEGEQLLDTVAITQYKSIIGALMHLANHTRPDIAFAVNFLARYMSCPSTAQVSLAQHVLKYLKGTAHYGLLLGGDMPALHAYCDADFAACTQTRRSTTAFVVKCGLGLISWKSSRQATVSRSTAEAEYIAAGDLTKEVQYIRQLFKECGQEPGCIPVGIDNEAAIRLINDPISAARTKHIDIVHHHIRERVSMGHIQFASMPSKDNPADILTKPLPFKLFQKHRSSLGVLPQP